MRVFWLIGGFLIGIIMSRNAHAMPTPVAASVFLGAFIGFAVAWFAGNRNKAEAVATAIAIANAKAEANAEAHSKAVANAAINLVLMSNTSDVGEGQRQQILDQSLKVVDYDADKSRVSITDTHRSEDHDKNLQESHNHSQP